MDKDFFVFDLDGTLIDSSGDIANAANRTLQSLGHCTMKKEAIKDKIGWGVKMLLENLMPDEEAAVLEVGRKMFLAYYGQSLLVETCLYPGVSQTLRSLSENGKKMAILTNKPEGLSRSIINGLELDPLFISITGGDTFEVKKPDPLPLESLMSDAGVCPANTVIVGDSPIDCETGRAAGVFTVGVSYGFRPVKELKDAGCDMIISDFVTLGDVFL